MDKKTISVEQLTFAYPPLVVGGTPEPLFHGLELTVAAGQSLAVVGRSGSGKSTLTHILAGLAPRYTGGELTGEVRIGGRDLAAEPPAPTAVGVLFQDAATQLFTSAVEDEVAWGLEALGTAPTEIGPVVMDALRKFGLLEVSKRPPWALSGGQQKRLALASLWALRPRVWLLDEPLGGLDPAGRVEVLAALTQLRQEGVTQLFTTARVTRGSWEDSAALLTGGALTAPATWDSLHAQHARLVAAGLLCPAASWARLERSARAPGSRLALEARHLRYAYPDGPAVLHGLDLRIPQGQFVAVIGPNGAGKSTLIRHFNGLLRPTSGSLQVMERKSRGLSVGELARQVGFLFQRPEQQLFATTVREELAYGVRQLRLSNVEKRVERSLARFGLSEIAGRPPAILSYGSQRAVTLAALAALETPILVLDEPTVGLDGRGWAQLLEWVAERRAAGTTIIVVTHELALAARADRVLALRAGRIAADGPPDAVLSQFVGEE
ncbi:MAG TPA: ABC transporter ATP-binding protein [Thermoflexia bacterium]|nr:ABC transporter ATP-binding protein [Thermoflexia bacterium]